MLIISSQNDVTHDYSSTQINAPDWIEKKVIAYGRKINDKDIFTDPNDESYGRQDGIHVTVKYGIHTTDYKKVEELVSDFGDVSIKLGKVTKFESERYDVLKIDIESEALRELNKIISKNLTCTDTHPVYKPHMTIAYIKKDSCKDLIDDDYFDGIEFTGKVLQFSAKNGTKTNIEL